MQLEAKVPAMELSFPLANRAQNVSSNCPIPCADGDAAWRQGNWPFRSSALSFSGAKKP